MKPPDPGAVESHLRAVDFDVMTELVFADRQAFEALMGELAEPGVGARVVEDEEKFLLI
jgi:EthD domain